MNIWYLMSFDALRTVFKILLLLQIIPLHQKLLLFLIDVQCLVKEIAIGDDNMRSRIKIMKKFN